MNREGVIDGYVYRYSTVIVFRGLGWDMIAIQLSN